VTLDKNSLAPSTRTSPKVDWRDVIKRRICSSVSLAVFNPKSPQPRHSRIDCIHSPKSLGLKSSFRWGGTCLLFATLQVSQYLNSPSQTHRFKFVWRHYLDVFHILMTQPLEPCTGRGKVKRRWFQSRDHWSTIRNLGITLLNLSDDTWVSILDLVGTNIHFESKVLM